MEIGYVQLLLNEQINGHGISLMQPINEDDRVETGRKERQNGGNGG